MKNWTKETTYSITHETIEAMIAKIIKGTNLWSCQLYAYKREGKSRFCVLSICAQFFSKWYNSDFNLQASKSPNVQNPAVLVPILGLPVHDSEHRQMQQWCEDCQRISSWIHGDTQSLIVSKAQWPASGHLAHLYQSYRAMMALIIISDRNEKYRSTKICWETDRALWLDYRRRKARSKPSTLARRDKLRYEIFERYHGYCPQSQVTGKTCRRFRTTDITTRFKRKATPMLFKESSWKDGLGFSAQR